MSGDPRPHVASFEIIAERPRDVVLAGFVRFGLAGLTAVDYLVDQFDFGPTGRVTADGLPAVTPFENGRPRHHTEGSRTPTGS